MALLLAVLGWVKSSKKAGLAEGKAEATVAAATAHNEAVNQQNVAVAEENKAIVKEVEATNEVHDRLNADPAFAERVRSRFTRPD